MKLRWRMLPMAFAAIILLGGIALFSAGIVLQGEEWAMQPWNDTVCEDGVLNTGSVTDRNGLLLTTAQGGERRWIGDELTRLSMLHIVGDPEGNIGTGVLSAYPEILAGYDLLNGLYSADYSGGTLRLSADTELSRTAYEALEGRNGAVLVCNYETGEILCAVSGPSFDPADPAAQIPDGAYLNRGISAVYPPGSIFKIVTAAAALEQIPDVLDRVFWCEGGCYVGDDYVSCSGYHGEVTLEDAFAVSCNCAFAELALELGGETLQEYADAFGLTVPQQIGNAETAAGGFDAYPDGTSHLAWSGIGQATDLVCPAAFLRVVCAAANDGVAPDLTLLRNGNPNGGGERLMPGDTAEKLLEMMDYAVSYTYGDWSFPDLEMHAKSGTAEVDGEEPHAWFAGFVTNPGKPYAFVVILENGGSGAEYAGAVANTVMQQAVFG